MLGATVIGLLIFVFSGDTNNTNKSNDNVASSVEELVEDSYEVSDATEKDIEQAKKLVGAVIENIRTKNGFLNVLTGENDEDFDSYYYNKNGEIFAIGNKDNYCNVYRKDAKAIIFTDYIYEDYAIDTISLIENALNAVGTKGVKMEKYTSSMYDTADKIGLYDITIESWEGIRALYEPVSKDFADSMIKTMKESLTETWDPYFKFRINVTDEGLFAAQCVIKVDNTLYTQWAVDGYAMLYDWELPKEWYEIDLTDGEKAEEMLGTLMESIGAMLEKYIEENPNALVNTKDEVVTDNGDGTHTHPDGTTHDNTEHKETEEQGSKKEDAESTDKATESTEKTDESTVSWGGTVELTDGNVISAEEAITIIPGAEEKLNSKEDNN